MRLEHYPEKKFKKEVLDIVGKYLDLDKYRVFFFGSRVSGQGSERSDIDIGIEGPEPVPAAAKMDIEEELYNLPTLYTIEVVDFKKIDPEFKQRAKKHIEYAK